MIYTRIPRKIFQLAVTVAAMIVPLLVHAVANYYVSPSGDDVSNNGSLASPFKTIEKAKSELRLALPTATEPINVWLRGGTYYLSQALEFGPDDSGSSTAPVTYSAYADEDVVISGAILLSPSWSSYSGNIQVATIGAGLEFECCLSTGILK